MALLERLAILITADAAGAVGEMKKVAAETEKNLGKAGDATNTWQGTLTKASAAMMGAGAGLLAVGISAASSTTDLGREVMKLQRYTGMNADEASKLRGAAQLSGVQVDSLAIGLGRLSKAAEANSPAFKNLGIDVRNADGSVRNIGDLLPDIAEKFKEMGPGTERTAAALQLFGRSGMDLMPFLQRGRDGIEELSNKAKDMGLVLSSDNISAIKDNITAQRELKGAFDGVKTKIGLEMVPILSGFTKIVQGIPGPVLDVIGPLTVFGGLGLTAAGGIGLLIGQLKNLVPALSAMTTWLATANPATLAIIGLGVAIAAAAAAVAFFGSSQKKDQASIDSFTEALRKQGDEARQAVADTIRTKYASQDLGDALIATGADMADLTTATSHASGKMRDFADLMKHGHNAEQQADALSKLTTEERNYVQAVLNAEDAHQIDYKTRQKLLGALADMQDEYKAANASLGTEATLTEGLAPKVSTLAQAQAEAAGATSNHSDAIKSLNDRIRGTFEPFTGYTEAVEKQRRAQQDLTDATDEVRVKEEELAKLRSNPSAKPSDIIEAEKALREARDKLTDANGNVLKSTTDLDTAQRTLFDTVAKSPEKLQDALAKVEEYGRTNRLSADQVAGFKKLIIDAGWEAVMTAARLRENPLTIGTNDQELRDTLQRLALLRTLVNPDTGFVGLEDVYAVGRAVGGPITPGQPYLVGELGPELIVPSSAGTVLTAQQTSQALSGGQSIGDVNVYVTQSDASPYEIGREMVWALRVAR